MRSLRFAKMLLTKLLPIKFIKHYIYPLYPIIVRRKQVSYDAKKYFTSYYQAMPHQKFSDRITISPDCTPLFAHYHYNAVENSIIEYFASRQILAAPQVLDIGSGAGHWINFYLDVFRASSVIGVEISKPCVDMLNIKYKEVENVCITDTDISSPNLNMGQKFDIINAIGVMFHLVDDTLWKQAVQNFANHLTDRGIIVIGGQFGLVTQNVQFHNTDEFSTMDECKKAKPDEILVNKRIRSLRFWKKCTKQAGLRIDRVQRTRQWKGIRTPENNILILSRK